MWSRWSKTVMYNDTITKTSECDQDKVRQKCIMTQ